EWIVTNTGAGPTNSPVWYDKVYLSLDNVLDGTDVVLGTAPNPSYLNAGESYVNSLTVTLPQGIQGNYYVLIKTDCSNTVFEADYENDNLGLGGPTYIDLSPPPDLQVISISAPGQAFSGQPVEINWQVSNEGPGRTLETVWYDAIYLSSDPTLDPEDTFMVQVYHSGSLNPGEYYTVTKTVTLPIAISGDFYFLVCTDIYNQAYEHAFENNNVGYDATHINLTPPPDLVVETVSVPTTALTSHPLTITYKVSNAGATATPNSSWTDSFYLSEDDAFDPATDLLLGNQRHYGTLDAGASYANSVTYNLPHELRGDFHIFVITDYYHYVFELDKANNILSSSLIAVESRPPDLVIESASAPTTAQAGGQIQVTWTVKNVGSGDTAVNEWTDEIYASLDAILDESDVPLGSFNHTGLLNPEDSYTQSQLVTIPFDLVGQYQILVKTDLLNRVYEGINEDNNVSSALPLSISRQTPDLQVTSLTAPKSAEAGTSLAVAWTVQNLGQNRTYSNYWYDTVYLSKDQVISADDVELGSLRRSNPLNPSASYEAQLTLTLPLQLLQGDYYLLVRTDSTNLVLEDPWEQNNDSSTQITITPGTILIPDLTILSVEAPPEAVSGQPFSLTWKVRNNGDPTGDRTWYDAVFLSLDQIFDRDSDIYLGYRYHSGGLATGETYAATQEFTVPKGLTGPYYVFVVADRGNHIAGEASELNNSGYDPYAMVVTLAPPADLVIGEITVPVNAVPGQNATISYTVYNQGTDPAIGKWHDSIYISKDDVWDINDEFFGRVLHSGDVPGGASYSESLTAPLPGVAPGEYHVIIRSDILNHVRESNEANNIGATLDQIAIDVEQLLLGIPDSGTLGQGQSVFYRLEVPAGETLVISFDSESANAFNEIYLRYGEIPTRGQFDVGFSKVFSPDQEITLSSTRGGTYYLLIYGNTGEPANYTIRADILQFSIRSVTPDHGSNLGQVTVTLEGAKFSPDCTAYLMGPDNTERPASQMMWVDGDTIWATFDLKGLSPGLYDVRLEDDGLVTMAKEVFTVNNGVPGEVQVHLFLPRSLRPGQQGIATLEYANVGETDVQAPLFSISSDSADLWLPGKEDFTDSSIMFLAINEDGPAGILPPRETGSITFLFRPTISGGQVNFWVSELAPSNQLINWNLYEGAFQPFYIADSAWEVLWDQFVSGLGPEVDDYLTSLAENATRLSQLGFYTSDVGELLQFELLQASSALPIGNLTTVTDVLTPAPGFPLSFTRFYDTSLVSRNTLGALGYGWKHQWEIEVRTDSEGNVCILFPSGVRVFQLQADGTFLGGAGEYGILRVEVGKYRLQEADGTLIAFRPDGKWDYIEDTNGNRLTAGYDGGRLTSVTHSNGDRLTLSYNAQGRLVQVTDPVGRVATYAYDAAGEHLLSVTTSDGTTAYAYASGLGAAREHALTSIAYPGGYHEFFAYDENFKGGVRVAAGDIDKDGWEEIICGAGQGGGPHVRVFERDGTPKPIQFFAFHSLS
ncbi:MAG: CARDB domain-containing protein, partial [candidate division WOR-3 bacterium]